MVDAWKLLWQAALLLKITSASNWAQVSGNIKQNVVVPYFPGPNQPHWGARYGMATVVAGAVDVSSLSYLYVIGGDTYNSDTTSASQQPGLLDQTWDLGYKNDVWKMDTPAWLREGDPRLRGPYGQKIPKVQAILKWQLVSPGRRPPPRVTYEQWISCEPYFGNTNQDCEDKPETQWSPRRHHAAVFFKGQIYVMGGRAREFVELPEERSIGGIIGPRVKDISSRIREQKFTTQREASVLKSDVWRSEDGISWELVTPGCRAPQKELVAEGFKAPDMDKAAAGTARFQCNASDPKACYGAEKCDPDTSTCVCEMWTPREQHAVTNYGGYLYVSGGYASRLYGQFSNCGKLACGDTDAGAYRYFLADVWRSTDGGTWERLQFESWKGPVHVPGYPPEVVLGRGGHQMLAIKHRNGDPYLYVFGGRGGDNTVQNRPQIYFNDIWRSNIKENSPTVWERVPVPGQRDPHKFDMPWEPRTGLAVALEEGNQQNLGVRTLYLYGGVHNGTYLDDMWAWRFDEPAEYWRKDFTPDAFYSTGEGSDFQYHTDSPSKFYVHPDSDLSMLQKFWVPVDPDHDQGQPLERRVYLPPEKVEIMNSVGLQTIRDLAEVDLYTLLKLRGFDYPQVPKEERLKLYDICDYRALAIALVKKCTLTLPSLYDGQRNMPWNIEPVFGGPPPSLGDKIKWHGRDNYDFLLPDIDDPTILTEKWDGCTWTPQIEGLFGPNIDGLGYVDQVKRVRNPARELQELFCRQTPGPRAHHSMVVFQEKLYLLGGKAADRTFHADTWYRDSRLPIARFGRKPGSRDTFPWFYFQADKEGAFFEYRVWDPNRFKEIRPWTRVTKKTSVEWLDWRVGGPGNGRYQLYVRAVDPAGNRDAVYVMGRNVYSWYYLSPTPWDIILGTIFGFLFLCFLAYMEYRRRVKKAAMERYAMKRMRRKFKAMQRDINGRSVDWRTLYLESKEAEEAGTKEKKRKKKVRDKNAEKREKERKKREKEKELIKKKLQASKVHKDKKKGKDLDALEEGPPPGEPPKKLTGGKKSRVAPGSGEGDDDSDVGLEELLLADEATRAEGVPVKKVKPAAGKGKSKGGVAPGDGNDGIEAAASPNATATKQKAAMSAKPPVASGSVAIADTSKEINAGQLKASADTETGTKQRKVNKRLQDYGDGGGDGGGGSADPKKNA